MRKVLGGLLHLGYSAFHVEAIQHFIPYWITKVTNDRMSSIGEKR